MFEKKTWSLVTSSSAADLVLSAESEENLQEVNEFYVVCKRRMLKVNASKSKEIAFERRVSEVVGFVILYRIN